MSRRVGASTALLRVWERRYGLLEPQRLPNGYRVYAPIDVRRAADMQAHLARGVAPAEAARLAKAVDSGDGATLRLRAASDLLVRLRTALDRFDGAGASRVLDRCLLNLGLADAILQVFLPYLRELGDRWERGEVTIAAEHFASNLVRRGLLGAAEGWEDGDGAIALLACAPGEQHDIGLICFGLALHGYHGWRISYLGADTPVAELMRAAGTIKPDLVVTTAITPARFIHELSDWRELSTRHPLAIAGAGASARLARKLRATYLSGDPVTAAGRSAAG